MRYELSDHEWGVIKPMLPNKPRGVPRVDDRGHGLKHQKESPSRLPTSRPGTGADRSDRRAGAGCTNETGEPNRRPNVRFGPIVLQNSKVS